VARLGEVTISLDLSHIGLSIDAELAMEHLCQLAEEANIRGYSIMISMEESAKTDAILDMYTRTTERYPHVGITLQAHLHRTQDDLQHVMKYPGKIRMVKGAFQEPSSIAMPRSAALNERYLHCVEQLVKARHPVSIATHDQSIVDEIMQRGYGHLSDVEFEMLYGICPYTLKRMREKNVRTKVYLTYGEEWYLYFCHRLAEHPPNIYQAISDLAQPPHGIDDIY
jgi:proline dehydrogenase